MSSSSIPFRVTFLGASGTVTGSKYLVETHGKRILVDCGLFQGYKTLRLRNWSRFPVEPASIDAVVLTHAHIDHSGYLPRLARSGFRGAIWATPATAALCEILLTDSARIQEDDADFANRRHFSKHNPALPLYTEADARRCLKQFRTASFEEPFEPVHGVHAQFHTQGHILGAARVALRSHGRSLVFSGDVGRPDDDLMAPPSDLGDVDWLVVESTYGDRLHPQFDIAQELGSALRRVAARGGVAVIPAFAVGRTQLLLHHIAQLKRAGAIPSIPVYLDSPMAIDVTGLFHRYRKEHRLSRGDCEAMCKAAHYVNSMEDSRALHSRPGPMVIIAGSGMATGGRVLHHLTSYAPHPRNMIILAGYQAGGTRGAALAAGASTLRIHGQDVDVRAEVVALTSASSHADANELIAWMRTASRAPRHVFVTHGEPAAADALRSRIAHELGWPASVPEYRDEVELGAQGPGEQAPATERRSIRPPAAL
ncbi:MBL fold metallo-hydrolase RNA specificity domain-containing protein [Tahibacter amnicola]|uniref:MBL fold metallo-hydrolase n=1 Tax=Tahibacter amnicola TaxID=2976241 RepID=A0ABY6B8R3_9GAMM|nr:MBL fold metallo-hydrolase [Tahibacter amnicola]UXI66471.1 MBL fold metallo-hydrolase [Tahibacter amnicola]